LLLQKALSCHVTLTLLRYSFGRCCRLLLQFGSSSIKLRLQPENMHMQTQSISTSQHTSCIPGSAW
jgi:hypothetical protein